MYNYSLKIILFIFAASNIPKHTVTIEEIIVYDTLDKIMSYHHLTKTAKGVYEGDNANDFIGLYFYLYDLNWFMNYVGKWYSYHDGGMEDVIKSVNIKERQIANEFR